jgi:hypothetical protein
MNRRKKKEERIRKKKEGEGEGEEEKNKLSLDLHPRSAAAHKLFKYLLTFALEAPSAFSKSVGIVRALAPGRVTKNYMKSTIATKLPTRWRYIAIRF